MFSLGPKGPGSFPGLMLIASVIILISACAPKHSPETHIVVIKGLKFIPDELKVSKGDTVIWVNEDLVMHDVTEAQNADWHSGVITSGSSWKKVITKNMDYFCSLHVVMKGKLLVE